MPAPWKESYDKPRQHIKKQRHHFADKGPYSQSYGFSSSHVGMWELDHKEGWVPKIWCLGTVWCWRRLLRVPWTARRSDQSILKITLYAKQKKRHRCTEQTFRLCGRREGGMFWENSIETSILSRVKQITSPGWMHETGAQGWCTGKTQRDGMEREAGGDIGMGNTCKSMADSCQCMAKTTTILYSN